MPFAMSTIRETLLHEIAAFRLRHGLAETRFGELAVGDGKFVARLLSGQNVGINKVDRVRAFMAQRDGQQDATSKTGAAA